MPNHTDNRVVLSHDDPQRIDYIYNIMNTDDAELCQALIPMDENLLDNGDWYEWRLENWGTKWDVYETRCDRIDANTLHLYFYTAWSPPMPIYEKLTDMGFDVTARYLDEGWMFIGEYNNGDDWVTDDVDSVVEHCPELDEEFEIQATIERIREIEEEERAEANG